MLLRDLIHPSSGENQNKAAWNMQSDLGSTLCDIHLQ